MGYGGVADFERAISLPGPRLCSVSAYRSDRSVLDDFAQRISHTARSSLSEWPPVERQSPLLRIPEPSCDLDVSACADRQRAVVCPRPWGTFDPDLVMALSNAQRYSQEAGNPPLRPGTQGVRVSED